MLLTDRIQATAFSAGEQTAVDYIMEQKENIRNMTVKEIAGACYCVPSTLIRIAHKLGFEGWNALKESFLEEMEYLACQDCGQDANVPFEAGEAPVAIGETIAALQSESIEDTCSMLDALQLHKATVILKNARIIYLLTLAPNRELAGMFQAEMLRIGRTVVIADQPLYTALIMDPQDCAIILSYSGETDSMVEAGQLLNERKIPFIAISNIGDTSLSRLAQASLKMCTREKLYSKIGSFSSAVSAFYLLYVLYACLFERDYERNFARKVEISRQVERVRTTTTSLIQEKPDPEESPDQ